METGSHHRSATPSKSRVWLQNLATMSITQRCRVRRLRMVVPMCASEGALSTWSETSDVAAHDTRYDARVRRTGDILKLLVFS